MAEKHVLYILKYHQRNVIKVGIAAGGIGKIVEGSAAAGRIDMARSAIVTSASKRELESLAKQIRADYTQYALRGTVGEGLMNSGCLHAVLEEIMYKINRFPQKALKLTVGIGESVSPAEAEEGGEEDDFSPWPEDRIISLNDRVPILEFEPEEIYCEVSPLQVVQSRRYLLPGCGFIRVTAQTLTRMPLGVSTLAYVLREVAKTDGRSVTLSFDQAREALEVDRTPQMLAKLAEVVRSFRHIGASADGVGGLCSFRLVESIQCPRPYDWNDSFTVCFPRDLADTFGNWFSLTGFDPDTLEYDVLEAEDVSRCLGLKGFQPMPERPVDIGRKRSNDNDDREGKGLFCCSIISTRLNVKAM